MRRLRRDHLIGLAVVALVFFSALLYPLLSRPGPDSWNSKELAVLAAMQLRQLPAPPPDPSNRYEGLPAAIALGRSLFHDARLSANNTVSCAHCHVPGKQFQDNLPRGQGLGQTSRRTPSLVAASYQHWFFWDGRKDSLWSQALASLESPQEHGSTRLQLAHVVVRHYAVPYRAVFGELPDLQHLPANASPLGNLDAQNTWASLSSAQQDQVNRVFANIGKALAAYEKTLQFGPAPIDRYIAAVLAHDQAGQASLSLAQKRGLRLFMGMGQCTTCHNGPLLTDLAFHNIGVPDVAKPPDPGRGRGFQLVEQDEFNCLGRYSDAKATQCNELRFMSRDQENLQGSFKTPGLRNVALRAPYMHQGQLTDLTQVVAHYMAAPAAATGHNERDPMPMNGQDMADLAAFLQTLSGPVREIATP